MPSNSAVWKVAWVVIVMRALLRERHCQLETSSSGVGSRVDGSVWPKLTLFDIGRGGIEDEGELLMGMGENVQRP